MNDGSGISSVLFVKQEIILDGDDGVKILKACSQDCLSDIEIQTCFMQT